MCSIMRKIRYFNSLKDPIFYNTFKLFFSKPFLKVSNLKMKSLYQNRIHNFIKWVFQELANTKISL